MIPLATDSVSVKANYLRKGRIVCCVPYAIAAFLSVVAFSLVRLHGFFNTSTSIILPTIIPAASNASP